MEMIMERNGGEWMSYLQRARDLAHFEYNDR